MGNINPQGVQALAKLGIAPQPEPPEPEARWDDLGSIEEVRDPERRYLVAAEAQATAKAEIQRVQLETRQRVAKLRELSQELTMVRADAVRQLHRRGHSLTEIAGWLQITFALAAKLDGLASGRRSRGQ